MVRTLRCKLIDVQDPTFLPSIQNQSNGYDIRSTLDITFLPGEARLIPNGFALELPVDTIAMVCSRSGLAAKHSITVLNAPGIVDHNYRGEFKTILINHGVEPFLIQKYDRIAQIVFVKTEMFDSFQVVDDFDMDTARGEGGFGSTGIK